MARPLKPINWDIVKKKIEAGCTAKEIFNTYDCQVSEDTFYRRFQEEFGCSFADYETITSSNGMGDLKLTLHAKAMQGNITALIFLATRRIGMKEPESSTALSNAQTYIDQSHLIMQLQHRISELEANANQPQAE